MSIAEPTDLTAARRHARYLHASRRAQERHGVVLSRDRWEDLVRRIDEGHGSVVFLARDRRVRSRRHVAVRVEEGGAWLVAVYDEGDRVILTILPGDVPVRFGWKLARAEGVGVGR